MNIKEDSFSDLLLKESFFLLVKPEDNIYSNNSIRNSFFEELGSLVKLGLKNIEVLLYLYQRFKSNDFSDRLGCISCNFYFFNCNGCLG